ncbi:MAG: cupin domain-containing protein [Roseitalea porphyridii]|jgi:transcriptional regulator with XRE-family HTH domain|uniref:cupin domain-containing protein n=1 Tax=Roseitalea porphyridii TaxID=1852022 RepID=UPI0006918ACF
MAEARNILAAARQSEDEFNIGERLRQLRTQHGLSQTELAQRSGISNVTISQIERNKMAPSIAVLHNIVKAFPVSLAEFFDGQSEDSGKVFFRREDLTILLNGTVRMRQVGHRGILRSLQLIHVEYDPGADSGPEMLSHAGEEGGVIISGRLEVTVGDKTEVLEAGDAYLFPSTVPHRFRNVGDTPCVIVCSAVPPSV